MRLLNARSLTLTEFLDAGNTPTYAILSHTWGLEEVSLQELEGGCGNSKTGFSKIQQCARLAIADGFSWIWVDTCCIDKTSSAELSEAINSMFKWYRDASICYAYLEDITLQPSAEQLPEDVAITKSVWFTRGWTLQELLAPRAVIFFSANWDRLCTRQSAAHYIWSATGIDEETILSLEHGHSRLRQRSVAKRMAWAANRKTTRSEDIAYSLLGLFDVNMPLLYGEGGSKAFVRLQEEIIKHSSDQSILAWTSQGHVNNETRTPFATSPHQFIGASNIASLPGSWLKLKPFSMTNKGLRIQLPIVESKADGKEIVAALACHHESVFSGPVALRLSRIERDDEDDDVYEVDRFSIESVLEASVVKATKRTMYISRREYISDFTPGSVWHHIFLREYPERCELIETIPTQSKIDHGATLIALREDWTLQSGTLRSSAFGFRAAFIFNFRNSSRFVAFCSVGSFRQLSLQWWPKGAEENWAQSIMREKSFPFGRLSSTYQELCELDGAERLAVDRDTHIVAKIHSVRKMGKFAYALDVRVCSVGLFSTSLRDYDWIQLPNESR